MIRFPGCVFDGFSLQNDFAADNRFMGNTSSNVMNRSSAGQEAIIFLFVFSGILGYGSYRELCDCSNIGNFLNSLNLF